MRFLLVCSAILGCTLSLPQRNPYEDDRRAVPQYLKFSPQDAKALNLKQRGFILPPPPPPNQIPTGFRSTAAPQRQEEAAHDNTPAPSQQLRRPAFEDNYPNVLQQVRQQQPQHQGQFRRPSPPQQFRQQLEDDKELEEEVEEPDRLSLLLPNSKFDCAGKNTGYYADEGLQCEVFHYCQEETKHSWICPEGFTFHQVHLICMPPSGDNICQKSSEYHFVNEYLYKPLNAEEHENKPNVTLRYSDRYYPEHYNYGPEQSDEGYEQQQPRRQPVQVQYRRPLAQANFSPTLRPDTHLPAQFRPSGQVFHSPEEVNISLQQRRPLLLAPQRPQFPSHREDTEIEYHK